MNEKIAVIGGGQMGSQIAALAAMAGYKTNIYDENKENLEYRYNFVEENIKNLIDKKIYSEDKLESFKENLELREQGKYLFICRSGIRSNFAALTVEESFKSGNYNGMCFNIEDGFEGHDQPSVYPQNPTGWKNLGLPWSRVI